MATGKEGALGASKLRKHKRVILSDGTTDLKLKTESQHVATWATSGLRRKKAWCLAACVAVMGLAVLLTFAMTTWLLVIMRFRSDMKGMDPMTVSSSDVQFEHTLSTGGGVQHRVELAGAAPAISLADGGNITAQSSVSLQHRRKTAGDAEARLHVAPGQANFTAASIACGAGAASFVAASSSVFRIEADAVRFDSATVSTPKATVDRLASAEGADLSLLADAALGGGVHLTATFKASLTAESGGVDIHANQVHLGAAGGDVILGDELSDVRLAGLIKTGPDHQDASTLCIHPDGVLYTIPGTQRCRDSFESAQAEFEATEETTGLGSNQQAIGNGQGSGSGSKL